MCQQIVNVVDDMMMYIYVEDDNFGTLKMQKIKLERNKTNNKIFRNLLPN